MSREIASHIFDPFYTTKAPGRGRGLGLSVCHRVVSEAGGVIAVQSEPGRGSSFTVRLKETESRCNET
jgi:signal transduction histidine kinase